MPPLIYSVPPIRPELDPASLFYPTLQSYILFGGSKGLPRDVVHNALPRRSAGIWQTSYGEDPKIIASAFPNSPAADGGASNYALRAVGGSRSLVYVHGGFNSDSGHGTVGPAETLFCVFQCEEMIGYQGAGYNVVMLCASGPSAFTNGGGSGAFGNITGQLPLGLCLAFSGGNVYFGFTEDSGFAQAIFPCNTAPVVKGHWYLGAVSFFHGTDSFSTPINEPRRVYLHDLTTNTRICGTVTDDQHWAADYWPFGVTTNAGYQSTYLPASQQDLVIFPGAGAGGGSVAATGTIGHFCGKIHLAGVDQQFWDDSGKFAAIPAAFSGTDPFSAFVANIYSPLRSTYVTGGSAPTLVNVTDQALVSTNTISLAGQGKQAGAYSTIANVVGGVPANLGLLFLGDAVATKVTDTGIEITASRPQAGPAAITSYSLYGNTSYPFTVGPSFLLATQTVAGDALANVFQYNPPDTQPRFYVITATDGTNTYTYPMVLTAKRDKPPVWIVLCGNSYAASIGGAVWAAFGRSGAAWGFDCPVVDIGFDGAITDQWTTGAVVGVGGVPTTIYGGSTNPLAFMNQILARETAALGRPVDVAFCWLIENNTSSTPSAYQTAMTTMQAAIGTTNLVHFSPIPFSERTPISTNGPGYAIGLSLPTIDNGGSIIVVGTQWAKYATYYKYGSHPDIVASQQAANIFMNDYVQRFVYGQPIPGNVRSGVVYGPSGGATGTLALPTVGNVRLSVTYGAGGTEFTGTYTTSYTAVSNVRSGIDRGDGQIGTLVLPSVSNVHDTVTYGGGGNEFTGTMVLPAPGDVEAGVGYGAVGGVIGTFVVPLVSQVQTGVGFGAPGPEFTGTLAGGTNGVLSNNLNGGLL